MARFNVSTGDLRDAAVRLHAIQSVIDELGREARARIDDLQSSLGISHMESLADDFRRSSFAASVSLADLTRFFEAVADQLEASDVSLARELS